ncbi:MAG: class I SAM-dependent methyltransferase [Chthoniobacterales bacterium]
MESSTPETPAQPTFEDFRKMARDESLSNFGRIGFPDSYRAGKEERIFEDIRAKLPSLDASRQTVVDIGPGCSGPAMMMIDLCRRQKHQLILVDSEEMLAHLPDEPFVTKVAGRYPDQSAAKLEPYLGKVDTIVCYSVLHYIFVETNLFSFLDHSLTLLADGGEMLIGDIPNQSKRKRFFSSPNGIKFHQEFTGTSETPPVNFTSVDTGKIDDSVLLGLVLRARAAGFDAYLLPQPPELPMANRREDLLIRKP